MLGNLRTVDSLYRYDGERNSLSSCLKPQEREQKPLSSGYSIEGQATEILARGCNGFIQKPFKINELSGEIRAIPDNKA